MTKCPETGDASRRTRLNLISLLLWLLAGGVLTAAPAAEAPEITHISFQTWSSPGMPHILVTLNQPVTENFLRRHLFFLVDGLEKLPVTLEPVEELSDLENREWRVQPVVEMPLDTQVQLKVKPGLLSPMRTEMSATRETVVEFSTFPTPRFLGVECFNNSGLLIRIYAPSSPSPSQGCNPTSRIYFVFSSPVTREMIRNHLVVEPALEFGGDPKDSHKIPGLSPNSFLDTLSTDTQLNRPRKQGQDYKILLPQGVKAATNYHLKARASEILDEFGRPLSSDIDFSFPTNNLPPSLVINQPISILERQVNTDLPVTVANIGELDVKFLRLTPEGIERSQLTVAVEPGNIPYRFPLKVRDWLQGRSGVLLGHLSTYPFTGTPRWFFTQVTPFHLHLKLSRDNSLVWVTDLETGKPIQGARVRIYRDRVSALTARPTSLSSGMTRIDGTALLDGTGLLDPKLENLNSWPTLEDPDSPGELLFVRVDRADEMALLPLADEFSVDAELSNRNRVPSAIESPSGSIRSWGTTAQGIYRIGDTVQFKIYVRNQIHQSFSPAPAKGYRLRVIDPMKRVIHQVEGLKLNHFGAFHGAFKVPPGGAPGWYQFVLTADFIPGQSWNPMRVLVGPPSEAKPYTRTASLRDSVRPMKQNKLRRSGSGTRKVLGGPGHHLPLEPEKTEYQVGETARILIRNPFPGAHALLTVERSGVQQSWSQVLESEQEFVEFEITPQHFPGVYFSATVMSPRSHLSRPTARMGYIGLAVRDPQKELTVEVAPRHSAYRPGRRVTLDLTAAPLHPADRQQLPRVELAVVVLDEVLLTQLTGRKEEFDPRRGFYRIETLALQNFNLLTPLIGIQNIEKKMFGSDRSGARSDPGSMHSRVGYWNPSLRADASGRATITFRLPERPTAWRVLVMAVTPGGKMGIGEGHFKVHPAGELLPPEPAAYLIQRP